MKTYAKAPAAVLDYGFDWGGDTVDGGPWLATGETLTASTWTVPAGITQTTPAPSFTAAGVTTIWLTGGTLDTQYVLTNHVTTSAGRQEDRSFTIRVTAR